jgi:uncharacterized protein (DUF427 family)
MSRVAQCAANRWLRKDIVMKAIWHGQVIAESDRTVDVGGYTYFPRENVRMDLLAAVPKSESDLKCPHGVQFYDVTKGAERSRRAAWSYLAPKPAMAQVDHWIGFWEDVEVK